MAQTVKIMHLAKSQGKGTLSVSGSAKSLADGTLSPSTPTRFDSAFVQVEGGDIRMSLNASAPGSGEGGGILMPAGTLFRLDNDEVTNARFLGEGGSSARLYYELVTYSEGGY